MMWRPASTEPVRPPIRSVEHTVYNPDDLAGVGIDEQGIVAHTHPNIAVRRHHQTEHDEIADPVVADEPRVRQTLAICPAMGIPTARTIIDIPMVAMRRIEVASNSGDVHASLHLD